VNNFGLERETERSDVRAVLNLLLGPLIATAGAGIIWGLGGVILAAGCFFTLFAVMAELS
jgi:hypothetical protein